MKAIIPLIQASGKRTAAWLRVDSIDDDPKARGFRGFEGESLAAGEHDLPFASVLLCVKPVGTARSGERRADVFVVTSSGLQKVGDDFEFDSEGQYGLLRRCVEGHLYVKDRADAAEKAISNALTAWIGQPVNPVNCGALCREVAQVIATTIPYADDISVEPSKEHRDQVIVTFATRGNIVEDLSLRRCVVPCYDARGEEDIYFVIVRLPEGYEDVEEDDLAEGGHHHVAARHAARTLGGLDIFEAAPVFDERSEVGRALLPLCDWSSADSVDIHGRRENAGQD